MLDNISEKVHSNTLNVYLLKTKLAVFGLITAIPAFIVWV